MIRLSDVEPIYSGHALLAEGPVWDVDTQSLLWVDIHRSEVHRWNRSTGEDRAVRTRSSVTALALCESGRLVAVSECNFYWLDADTGRLDLIGEATEPTPRMRMNDGKCDPAGRFLAGTMTLDRTPGASALYQLDRDLRITPLLGGLALSNGLGWSPDGRTFYFIDTPTRRVDSFDYDVATGGLSNRRVFVDLQDTPGAPDGLTVDAEGCLWVAMARDGAAVRRFGPRGETREVIDIPTSKVTSCTFGGPELDELYITTACFGLDEFQLADQPLAGAVFRVRLNVKGLPPARFLDVAQRSSS